MSLCCLWGDRASGRKYSSYLGKGYFEHGYPFWGVSKSDPALPGPGTRKNFSTWKGVWHCSSITAEETFQELHFSDTLHTPGELSLCFQRDKKGRLTCILSSSLLGRNGCRDQLLEHRTVLRPRSPLTWKQIWRGCVCVSEKNRQPGIQSQVGS